MPAFVYSCDDSGSHPSCSATVVHTHCACGLAMAQGAQRCEMCTLEDTVALDVDAPIWDGRTYPSWRNRRARGDGEGYRLLVTAIFNPAAKTYVAPRNLRT